MRRLIALLLSLAMLLPAGVAGASVVYCNMTKRTGTVCCCEKALEAEHAKLRRGTEGAPVVEQSGCCERRTLPTTAERNGTNIGHDSVPMLAAPVLAILPASVWVDQLGRELSRAPANARAPPPARSAPLFILNRTFLS